MSSDPPPKLPYDKPAGGWPAVTTGLKHMLRQKATLATTRALLRVNQPDGFDCPGCAWPEPDDPSATEFCENGMKAVAWEATSKTVGLDFFAKHPVAQLREKTGHWLEGQGRLTHPMRYDRDTDRYVAVSWGDAFAMIGQHLRQLDHPDRAVFYTSGRTSNEAAYLYQLFGRMLGTNNFPDCSNMCHESSGEALGTAIGVGKGTVTLADFDEADAIFVIGQNPGTNHPRMLTELQKASQRGAAIVTLNPMREPGLESFLHPQHKLAMLTRKATPISSLYLQPLVGGDLAALTGVCKLVLEAEDTSGGVLDHEFIRNHTTGFEACVAGIRATDWGTIETQSGLSRPEIQRMADVYLNSERVIICWAMGLTQHKHAVPTLEMVVNLLLLRGNLGKPGAGACPVRGHSNVQGDRTMGITERPRKAFLDALQQRFDFEPPRGHGLDVVGAIHAMDRGDAKVFIAMGGNFATATPDTPFTFQALEKCDLTVQVSTKLNHSHTVVGKDALILPCLGRTERDVNSNGRPQRVTVEDSMSQVHASAGNKQPASDHLRSEPAIVAGMAAASLPRNERVDWAELADDYGKVRDLIADTIPGFTDFNQRIDDPGGFYLGNAARDRAWSTDSGKAGFTVTSIPDLSLPPGQFRLMTMRSHDQYNTTVYDLDDRYRGVRGNRNVVFIHPDDLNRLGLKEGDNVDVLSHYADGKPRKIEGFTLVTHPITPGCLAGYFPELNPLVSVDSFADRSRTPTSKFIPVTLSPSGEAAT